MDPYDDYGYGGANPPRDYYAYPEHTEGHRRARGRTEVYGTLRQDVQGRDTEAPYIERLGDKTRVITQSQKYAPTVQPAGVVVSPHLEYAAPPIPGLPVNGFPNAYADEDRRGPQRQSRTQSRFNRTLPAYQTAYQTQPHVPVINNAVPEWPGYDYDSLHEDSVSDAGSDISFTFDLSSHKTGSKGAEHRETVSGSPDKKESGGSTTTNGNQHSPFHESVYRVLRSRYTGDIYARGDTIAELITEHNLGSSKRSQLPLLRWIHLESQYPSFTSLLECVSRNSGLNEDEREDAVAILQRTRETYERPILTPEGTKGKYLEPNLTEEIVYNKRLKVKKERSAQLLCIPYFCLAPYSAQSLLHTSHSHPMRTLLQSSYSSAPKKRDLQQAVCKLGYPLRGHCFHVPQLWSLVLNNSLLITCARLSASEIQRGLINIQLLPSPTEHKKTFDLHVSDGGSRTWLLPAEHCTTWLEFIAHFNDLTDRFDDNCEVVYKGVVRSADDWGAVIANAQEATVYMSLRNKRTHGVVATNNNISETEDEDSASVSSTNGDTRNDSSKPLGHESAENNGPKPSGSLLSSPVTYEGAFATRSLQDDTIPALKDLETKTSEASDPGTTAPNFRANLQASLKDFHLFLWLTAVPEKAEDTKVESGKHSKSGLNVKNTLRADSVGRSFEVDISRLGTLFSDMEQFLCSANFKKRRAYTQCRSHTLQEVEARLAEFEGEEKEEKEEEEDRKGRGEGRDREYLSGDSHVKAREHKKFVRTAKEAFQFFLPLHYTSGVIEKYWGAVYYMIDNEWSEDVSNHLHPDHVFVFLRRIMKEIAFSLSQGRGPLPWNITLPDEFGKAWLHLVMYFVLRTAERGPDRNRAYKQLGRCCNLVVKAGKELLRNITNTSLQEQEAALPLGIMSLIVRKLLKDVTLGQPDVCSTYYEYLKKLEQEVQVDPYSRAHQEKISFLRQEIECILKVLNDQVSCLTDLHSKVDQGAIKTRNRFPREREFYILHECIYSVNAKIQSFTEMASLASDLGIFNIRRIESNKDRQEAAILVFTIVTIIFLPLSFVSSYLGMNTTDIRNSDTPQWLFWACAIPLTTVVVGLALLIARKVEPARQVWGRFWNRWAAVAPDMTSGYPEQRTHQQFRSEPVAADTAPPQWPGYGEPVPLRRRTTRRL